MKPDSGKDAATRRHRSDLTSLGLLGLQRTYERRSTPGIKHLEERGRRRALTELETLPILKGQSF